MTNMNDTLHVVELFLINRGYDADKKADSVRDGHWALFCIEESRQSACSHCDEAFLLSLFPLLESGSYIYGDNSCSDCSEWSKADTQAALRAGGFKIDLEAR